MRSFNTSCHLRSLGKVKLKNPGTSLNFGVVEQAQVMVLHEGDGNDSEDGDNEGDGTSGLDTLLED